MIHITDKSQCCGCTACYNICPSQCIDMKEDDEGFLYPYVKKDQCLNCNLCEKVCIIYHPNKETEVEQKSFIIQNLNKQILKESTSGGAFTAIAEKVIAKRGIVFGAMYDEYFDVRHSWVDNIEELSKFRNSKYVQSCQGNTYKEAKEFLEKGRNVCYSGTPCQIEGLRNFLGQEYENLILIDVVCRAVPSPLIWKKYKAIYSEEGMKDIRQIYFRDKSLYGYEYSQLAFIKNNEVIYSGIESNPYLRAFFSNISDRPSCYKCPVKKRYRISDITVWDCFDIHKFNKELDNNQGVTRALVHTKKGYELIKGLEGCKVFEIDPDDAVKGVRELIEPVPFNSRRKQFFMDAAKMENKEFFDKYFPITFKVNLEYFMRKYLNKLKVYKIVKRSMKKILCCLRYERK